MHVKKGDTVLVISGNDRGKTGTIKDSMPRDGMIVVEGINMRWKHNKPTQQNPKGERVQRETPIHASNVKRVEVEAGKKKPAKKKAAAPKAKKTKASDASDES